MANQRLKKKRKNVYSKQTTILCIALGVFLLCLSVLISLFLIPSQQKEQISDHSPAVTVSFNPNEVFSPQDLTPQQWAMLQVQPNIQVSDGPRDISIGDSLDKILERFPTNYSGEQPEDEQILYCADYRQNLNGMMTVLPPRGLLSAENGREITVTLLSPIESYPDGTFDNYRNYPHVYCKFEIDPDSMTIFSIILGRTE